MRWSALLPWALSTIAFVLSVLVLVAGRDNGFMEDYHIIAFNTSTLGHNLLNATKVSPAVPTSTSSGFGSLFSSLTGEIENITSSIEGELNSLGNDLADDLAKELGIKEWYSFHIMNQCEGIYSPNATAKGASYNVTNCTHPVAMYHFNPTATINKELAKGGLNITLSQLGWPDSIQDEINDLDTAMDATFVLYCIAITASGLAMLGALLVFLVWGSRLLSFGNWGLATIAFLALLIASAMVTVAQSKIASEVNKHGNDIGIYAYKGHKFLAITWAATAAMLISACVWVLDFCLGRTMQKRAYDPKNPAPGWRYHAPEAPPPPTAA